VKRFKQLEVQVADLLLSDGGEGVDGVEPDIKSWLFGELGETGVLEFIGILDLAQGSHKGGSLGHHAFVISAESVHSFVEVLNISRTAFFDGSFCNWTEEAEDEVSSVETGGNNYSVYIRQ